eukprot:21475-Heterococcus_DN1.PRE.4
MAVSVFTSLLVYSNNFDSLLSLLLVLYRYQSVLNASKPHRAVEHKAVVAVKVYTDVAAKRNAHSLHVAYLPLLLLLQALDTLPSLSATMHKHNSSKTSYNLELRHALLRHICWLVQCIHKKQIEYAQQHNKCTIRRTFESMPYAGNKMNSVEEFWWVGMITNKQQTVQ